MLNDKRFLLIDFSNLVYISFFGIVAETKLDTENIPLFFDAHVAVFNKKMDYIIRRHALSQVVFALDKKPVHKYDIFPDYKKRDSKLKTADGSFFDPREAVLKELKRRHATVVYVEGHEADDAIASFVAQNFYSEVIIVTTDKDLWSVCEHPNAKIYNPIKGEYINKSHLRESFCVKDKYKVLTQWLTQYSQVKLYKTLWGDPSDNIPNVVPRMKKQLLPFIVASDGSWEDFKNKLDYTQLTERCKTLLRENVDKIKVNSELVQLKYNCKLVVETYKPPEKVCVEPIPLNDIF
jgi:5'-3' exonuclease